MHFSIFISNFDNSFSKLIGDRRKDMRNDFQNVVSQGAATAKVTYTQQSSRQPETSVTYYGRGGGKI